VLIRRITLTCKVNFTQPIQIVYTDVSVADLQPSSGLTSSFSFELVRPNVGHRSVTEMLMYEICFGYNVNSRPLLQDNLGMLVPEK